MAFIAALGILMAGVCLAVLCFPHGTLGRDTLFHEDQDNGTQVDSLTLASSNTEFAFSLYKQLALKNPDKNIVFSPHSISAAMAIVSLGANGNTLEEILEGLKFNLIETLEADIHQGFSHFLHMLRQPGDQVQISIGNALFVEKHLQNLENSRRRQGLCTRLRPSQLTSSSLMRPESSSMTM